jgi:hypothetical protein
VSTYLRNDAVDRFAKLVDLDSHPVLLDGGDPRMRPAVALTAALRYAATTSAPTPLSDSARLAMRKRLVATASVAPSADATPGITARISRRMTTLVGSVVILTSVAGVGVATARALPGSPFYDLKRATETVQLWATSGEAAKGQRHLEFARTRMAEAAKLPANSPYLASTLKAMDEQTKQANSDLIEAYRQSGSAQPLAELVSFARTQYTDLAQLGASLPAKLHQEAAYSATLLTGLSQEVRSVTVSCKVLCLTGGTKPSAPGPVLAPSVTPSAHPSGTKPTSHPTTSPSHRPSTSPSTSPSAPTNLIPTNLLPTLPPLLNNGGQPLPKLSPLPLLSSLAQLLGG